jgi:hypothetical protein
MWRRRSEILFRYQIDGRVNGGIQNMKFYIGVKEFKIPDKQHAKETITCGDDRFKEEIEFTDADFRFFRSLSDEALQSSLERSVDRILFRIGTKIVEEIKQEIKENLS